jgi:hypothetical protein
LPPTDLFKRERGERESVRACMKGVGVWGSDLCAGILTWMFTCLLVYMPKWKIYIFVVVFLCFWNILMSTHICNFPTFIIPFTWSLEKWWIKFHCIWN